MMPHSWCHPRHARVLKLVDKRAYAMLAAMTHSRRVLNLDVKAKLY